MKKRSSDTSLVNEYLQAVEGMKDAETDSFFYTRLKAKMEKEQGWSFPLKPVWMITALSLLLVINGFITAQQFNNNNNENTAGSSPLQNFASNYNLTIQSTY